MKCSDLFTTKGGKEWDVSKGSIKSGQYIEKYLADIFVVSKLTNDNW